MLLIINSRLVYGLFGVGEKVRHSVGTAGKGFLCYVLMPIGIRNSSANISPGNTVLMFFTFPPNDNP